MGFYWKDGKDQVGTDADLDTEIDLRLPSCLLDVEHLNQRPHPKMLLSLIRGHPLLCPSGSPALSLGDQSILLDS